METPQHGNGSKKGTHKTNFNVVFSQVLKKLKLFKA